MAGPAVTGIGALYVEAVLCNVQVKVGQVMDSKPLQHLWMPPKSVRLQ